MALKLRKYASIWWANLVAKRARKGKAKIHSWDQIRDKLKDKFLPSHYLRDNYLKLHHLEQGTKSVEEYTTEFEQLLLKCDLKEDESQTFVRCLSGLDDQIAHVIELHHTPLQMSLVPLLAKWNNKESPRVRASFPSLTHDHTPLKGPQTLFLVPKVPKTPNQPHLLPKHLLKEPTPSRMIKGDVFGAKA